MMVFQRLRGWLPVLRRSGRPHVPTATALDERIDDWLLQSSKAVAVGADLRQRLLDIPLTHPRGLAALEQERAWWRDWIIGWSAGMSAVAASVLLGFFIAVNDVPSQQPVDLAADDPLRLLAAGLILAPGAPL